MRVQRIEPGPGGSHKPCAAIGWWVRAVEVTASEKKTEQFKYGYDAPDGAPTAVRRRYLHLREVYRMDKEATNKHNTSTLGADRQPETMVCEVSVQCNRYRDPVPGMDPQVTLELLSGCGGKKAIGHVTVYHAIAIHGIVVVEKEKRRYVKMPRAPKGARVRHSDIVYPLNQKARRVLYDAVLQVYDQMATRAEAERQKTKLLITD